MQNQMSSEMLCCCDW